MSRLLAGRKRLLITLSALVAVAAVTGLVVFKPWLLLVDQTVHDEVPAFSTAAPADPGQADAAEPVDDRVPVQVLSGSFISHEHTTSGTARILRLADGTYQLVLENLSTSNGPDVRVWLSAGPVIEGQDGWFTAGQHDHLEVAPIKGNLGDQVYTLPAGTDPTAWTSVVLWCEDFGVSFGAAELAPPGA